MTNAKAELYSYIQNIKKQCPTLNKMTDVEPFCNKNNINLILHSFDDNGICGFACIGEKKDTIVLNSRRNEIESFFDFIHEFIHTKRHRNVASMWLLCSDKKQNSFLEWEANEGAAEFIAPYKLFIPAFSDLYDLYMERFDIWKIIYGWVNVPQVLAGKFGISEMMAIHRIENLSYEIEQYRSKGTVEGIALYSKKAQNKLNIVAKNYIDELNLEEMKRRLSAIDSRAVSAMGF